MKKFDIKKIPINLKDRIKKNYSLSKNSWFGIGGTASVFFQPNNKHELIFFLQKLKPKKFITIGSGSNILFKDTNYGGVIIKLGKEFSKVYDLNESVVAGAAALKSKVSEYAKNKGYSQFEFLSGIPGTVGGGVFMNAGCFGGQISDLISQITVIDFMGNEKIIERKEIQFSYRNSKLSDKYIIVEVLFKKTKKKNSLSVQIKIDSIKKQKKINQPSGIRTGGSTFKNPLNTKKKAWELIVQYGCDKLSFGKAKFSQHHCNFIDNTNLALSSDIEKLINETKKIIYKNSGIKLELEIKII
jgi:UDP-N-acetylmuramate dehydrogenase